MTNLIVWMIESSLFVLCILGIRQAFMGKIRYGVICAFWSVVLLRFLVPVHVISMPFSIGNAVYSEITAWEQQTDAQRQDAVGKELGQSTFRRVTDVDISSKISQRYQQKHLTDSASRAKVSRKKTGRSEQLRAWITQFRWKQIFTTIWGSVAAGLAAVFVVSNGRLLWHFKKTRVFYGKKGKIPVYTVPMLKSPCLYGVFCPAIYLPEDILSTKGEMSVEALEQIITHEWVHYKHKDHIWAVLRILLVSVYWFDPFLWIAVSCAKKDAELYCDESVIKILGKEKRFDYGRLLIRLAGERHFGEFRYAMMPMSRRGREMERRIRAIGSRKKHSAAVVLLAAVIAIAGFGVTSGTGLAVRSQKSDSTQLQSNTKVQKVSSVGVTAQNEKNILEQYGVGSNLQWMQGLWQLSASNHTTGNVLEVQGKAPIATGTENITPSTEQMEACKEVFQEYVLLFTEAVNTGKTKKLSKVLLPGSQAYQEQSALAKNYYARGIREKAKVSEVTSVEGVTEVQMAIYSNEKIRVSYADAKARIVSQQYCYTCEHINGKWMITKMKSTQA